MIEEVHDKQEHDEVEQPDGEYLEGGYVLVDRDPETKTKRRVDRAAAANNPTHQPLLIGEIRARPNTSSAPTTQPPPGLERRALPSVETPSQAPSAHNTRPPSNLERRPLSEAQKVEVVGSEKNGDV